MQRQHNSLMNDNSKINDILMVAEKRISDLEQKSPRQVRFDSSVGPYSGGSILLNSPKSGLSTAKKPGMVPPMQNNDC